ncbi:hypothetical protein [Flavobacterium pallidum]|uniref:TonB C-terminal domain-containing protein n=1 Tax=Flavobacterium pallidum TaxID=2172098 RepID=A0A2S1SKF1_9FLAO|nr:hypothetical protein [Flavobacterium pallidum]AWI26842.1 hypothetical protein HYN49_13555 [Flavobacterium pallidum]AWI26876.1 hypothetical protein HYN49_13725 [Flavobacterium pallidum]
MKTSLIITLFFSCFLVKAQSVTVGGRIFEADKSRACNPDRIFVVSVTPAKFDNSNGELVQRLNASIPFDKSISGEVRLLFTINCEAEAYGFQTIKGISEEIDNQIIESLEKMQSWIAGIQNGKPIDTMYSLILSIKKGKFKSK